jgi:glycosyltransferase involved in cell wall biosynthesis
MVTVSDLTKRDLISMRHNAKITVIPNGIDFKHISAIQPSDIRSDIFFSGRLIKEKNVDLLIKALAQIRKEIPGIRCIIAGDGPEMNSLQCFAKEFNLERNIKFIGFLENHDELIAILKSSQVCVSPSTREGFGIAALEAMACGLPVVTVDAPKNAVTELVNDKTGIICAPTPEAFAEGIITCLKRKDLMTDYCKERAQCYNWEKIVDDIEDFYFGIIEKE